jgi:hypothetical protein
MKKLPHLHLLSAESGIKMAQSPFCSFPFFSGSFLVFCRTGENKGLKASNRLPVLAQEAFKSLSSEKSKCHFTEGPFCH